MPHAIIPLLLYLTNQSNKLLSIKLTFNASNRFQIVYKLFFFYKIFNLILFFEDNARNLLIIHINFYKLQLKNKFNWHCHFTKDILGENVGYLEMKYILYILKSI